jgi:hypothetical protein
MEYYRNRFKEYLNENWPVSIGEFSWESASVFEKMAQHDYEASFTEWQQAERERSKDRARDFLRETECWERFHALAHRIRQDSVVPFVGAGLSVPSGFPPWGRFLVSLLADAPHARERVEGLIAAGAYEEAAQVALEVLGVDAFAEEISNRLGRHRPVISGPVALLPELFVGEVITTNFDDVISEAYRSADVAFNREICGSALRAAPAQLGADRHCLLRIHGEARSRDGRVLTRSEYEQTYDNERTMAGLFRQIAGIRSFLFVGCSLANDRTLDALRQIKAEAPVGAAVHYALLPLPEPGERNARRLFLSEAGIHPIYYPADSHDQSIEDMLVSIIEGGPDD